MQCAGAERDCDLYVVMGLNPERGVAEALHSFGHRAESIMRKVYGSWSETSEVNHLWDRFTRVASKHPDAVPGVGNIHFPPNAERDYDYQNSNSVLSEADQWLNFPNSERLGRKKPQSRPKPGAGRIISSIT